MEWILQKVPIRRLQGDSEFPLGAFLFCPFSIVPSSLKSTNSSSGYWVQFAKTGNPNKEGLVDWPSYDSSKDQHIELGEVVKVGQGLRKDKLDLWDRFDLERRKKR